ncbi:protein of unknown function [Pseudomonas putida KT2440]|uniref:Uncharacterized protein n=1 Tax=Pseudomonas putida (strain ATCC 47054 / DSM 6125 / CFBP 8728 / NCIMB 11950 / KT2440) TaxID=160488 RepID=A0A140FWD3_PSEPK|nr:protein of unknown function [Pseudomonas putida KT2440]
MPVDNLTRRFSFNVGGHLARLCARRLFGDRQLRFKRRLVESAAPCNGRWIRRRWSGCRACT